MPTIRLRCPTCHAHVELDREHCGKEVECGACMGVFVAADPGKIDAARPKPAAGPGAGLRSASDRPSRRRRPRHEDDEYDHDRPDRDEYDDDEDDDRLRRRRRYADPPRSRLAYILLAVFLGHLGVHNFYAGRPGPGVAQLVVFLASFPLMLVFIGCLTVFIPGIWAIVDVVTVDRDGDGRRMV